MFRVSLLPTRSLGLCGLGLIAAFAGAAPTLAADIEDEPPPYARRYDPPPYREYEAPPAMRRWSEREAGPCRVIHRRAIDQDGREVVRRMRVCDEGVVAYRSDWAARRPRHEYDDPSRYDRRYEAPRYEAAPRPPRGVGPDYRGPAYDDDLD